MPESKLRFDQLLSKPDYSRVSSLIYESKTRSQKRIKIVSVLSNHWDQDYTSVLDALNHLKLQGITFEYHLVGKAPHEELLYQYHDLNLQSSVFFHHFPSDDFMVFLKEADVFLYPSLSGEIIDEVWDSMAIGTLIIAVKSGNMSTLIKDSETGLLVEPLNPEAFSNALQKVYYMEELEFHEITMRARKLFENYPLT